MSKTLSIDRYAYLDPGAHGMPRKVRVNALKRVPERDRRKPPRVCRYCGGQVVLTTQERVYGRNKGRWPLLYRCTSCDARVGVHPYTHYPLGILANKELRHARMVHKGVFNQLWYAETPVFASRPAAYEWLAEAMGIEREACHWGLFDQAQCELAGALSRAKLWEHGRIPEEHPQAHGEVASTPDELGIEDGDDPASVPAAGRSGSRLPPMA